MEGWIFLGKIYTITELERIITPIAKQHGVSKVYLFGSYARGEATENSDIDLRIERGKIRSFFQLGGLYADLEDALGKSLDLVTSEALDNEANRKFTAEFKKHIEENQRLLYEDT